MKRSAGEILGLVMVYAGGIVTGLGLAVLMLAGK